MASSRSVSDSQPAYGAMSAVMSDHVYVTEQHLRIYTTPYVAASVSTPFDAIIAITACRKDVAVTMDGMEVQGSAIAAGPHERRVEARGVRLVVTQLDPCHPAYRLFRSHGKPIALQRDRFEAVDALLHGAYEGALSLADAQQLSAFVVKEFERAVPALPPLDKRVEKVMHLLYDNPRLQLEELASRNNLSYDRMSHLFMDELGISIRSFQVWVKLRRALMGIRYGQSLIELAQLAGFSDAAHLSRVYKQVYGAPPSYFYYSGNVKLIASFAGEIPGAPHGHALRESA